MTVFQKRRFIRASDTFYRKVTSETRKGTE